MPSVEDGASSRGLRGALADELVAEGPAFSEDSGHLLKFHGTDLRGQARRRERTRSGQEPDHIFMVRASVPGGALSADQWRAIDHVADVVADGAVRLTSRGGVQLHFVRKGGLRPLIRTLDQHLVTTLAACGDVVRNVVACPAPVADSRQKVLLDLAQRLAVRFRPRTRSYYEVWIDGEGRLGRAAADEEQPLYGAAYLPGSSRSGWRGRATTASTSTATTSASCPCRGRTAQRASPCWWAVAWGQPRPAGRHLPRLADPLGWVPADSVEDLAEAVILAFRDLGNREDRKRARLKYVLEELGVDAFRREVEARFGAPSPPRRSCPSGTSTTTSAGTARTTVAGSSACPCPAGASPDRCARSPRWSSATTSTCG